MDTAGGRLEGLPGWRAPGRAPPVPPLLPPPYWLDWEPEGWILIDGRFVSGLVGYSWGIDCRGIAPDDEFPDGM